MVWPLLHIVSTFQKPISSFLCRSNILVPVILKLEDFGLELDFEAVRVST
jgi:hypothetical protein